MLRRAEPERPWALPRTCYLQRKPPQDHFPAFEAKCKAAGLSTAAIAAFKNNYDQLVRGVTGLVGGWLWGGSPKCLGTHLHTHLGRTTTLRLVSRGLGAWVERVSVATTTGWVVLWDHHPCPGMCPTCSPTHAPPPPTHTGLHSHLHCA